jgi:hypothetical protein
LGVETFEFPTRKQDLIVCAVNMVITLSSDYLYVLAMLKTTPLGQFGVISSSSKSGITQEADA